MEIVKIYAELFLTTIQQIILRSGRNAGKSKVLAQFVVKVITTMSKRDVVVTRANYNSLKGSVFNEILNVISEEGLEDMFIVKTSPLHIICKLTGNQIYFKAVGGSDLSRTKGFVPNNPLSLIVIDECQQLPNQTNLDQALATFRRHIAEDGKMVLLFNPERSRAHWMNEYYRIRKIDEDWLCIESNWLDIAQYLSKLDIRAMLNEKKFNRPYYDWLYMGDTTGTFGLVYHTFNRDKHLISETQAQRMVKKHGIHAVIIGTDGASTRDATAFIPRLILGNGQSLAVDMFYFNHEKQGSLSNEQMMPLVKKWLKFIEKKWNISWGIQKLFSVDPAGNSDLKVTLNFHAPTFGKYRVMSYTQKDIVKNAQIVQNAYSRNAALIVDCDGYINYKTGLRVKDNPLVRAYESVIWDEFGTKFDKTVPNDTTDADTYGLNMYYKNPNNLYIPSFAKHVEYYD